MRLPKSDDIIGRSLRDYGEWAQIEISHLCKFIRDGDVVLDVGACFGTHTLAFAEQVGATGSVVACEASPINFRYLKLNAEACPYSERIRIVHAAAGRSTDISYAIQQDNKNFGATSTREANLNGSCPQTVTVDSLEMARLNFVKLDVEGMEGEVLAGAASTLAGLRPVVFFEVNSISSANLAVNEVKKFQYKFFGDITKAYNENNFRENNINFFNSAAECGIFAIPEERVSEFHNVISELNLRSVRNLDDIALLLLYKPQYFEEVLSGAGLPKCVEPPIGVMFGRDVRDRAELCRTIERLQRERDYLQRERDQNEVAYLAQRQEDLNRYNLGISIAGNHFSEKENKFFKEKEELESEKDWLKSEISALTNRVYLANVLAEYVSRPPFSIYFRAHPRLSALLRMLRPDDAGLSATSGLSGLATRPLSAVLSRLADRASAKAIARDFDANWYVEQYPDVATGGVDPVLHYVRYGAQEGRSPSPDFDGFAYLAANRDVHAAGIEPFYHWVRSGRDEGRALGAAAGLGDEGDLQAGASVANQDEPPHPIGYRAAILAGLQVKSANSYGGQDAKDALISCDEIASLATRDGGLIISFSHDDFITVPGGTQLCVGIEQKCADAEDVDYLHAYPLRHGPSLAAMDTPEDGGFLGISLNGAHLGVSSYGNLAALAKSISACGFEVRIIVHHAMGHKIEGISSVVAATEGRKCTWWLHDFFTLCESPHLLRNNVTFCGAPGIKSMACNICAYQGVRPLHLERMDKFFRANSVEVLAPSNFVADLFRDRASLRYQSLRVRPHMALEWRARDEREIQSSGPARIAYVGTPADHKGWPFFVEIAERFAGDARYIFEYFGSHEIDADIRATQVATFGGGPLRMVEALRGRNIDIVIHISPTPETFSFTTHEAIAAGALVLTNRGSGNTACAVEAMGRGLVVEQEGDIWEMFEGGQIMQLAKEARSRRSTELAEVKFSHMSLAR